MPASHAATTPPSQRANNTNRPQAANVVESGHSRSQSGDSDTGRMTVSTAEDNM